MRLVALTRVESEAYSEFSRLQILFDPHNLKRFFFSDSIRDPILTIATRAVTCSRRRHFIIPSVRQQHPVISSSLPCYRLFCTTFKARKSRANVVEEGLACSTRGGNINNRVPKPHEGEDGAGGVG